MADIRTNDALASMKDEALRKLAYASGDGSVSPFDSEEEVNGANKTDLPTEDVSAAVDPYGEAMETIGDGNWWNSLGSNQIQSAPKKAESTHLPPGVVSVGLPTKNVPPPPGMDDIAPPGVELTPSISAPPVKAARVSSPFDSVKPPGLDTPDETPLSEAKSWAPPLPGNAVANDAQSIPPPGVNYPPPPGAMSIPPPGIPPPGMRGPPPPGHPMWGSPPPAPSNGKAPAAPGVMVRPPPPGYHIGAPGSSMGGGHGATPVQAAVQAAAAMALMRNTPAKQTAPVVSGERTGEAGETISSGPTYYDSNDSEQLYTSEDYHHQAAMAYWLQTDGYRRMMPPAYAPPPPPRPTVDSAAPPGVELCTFCMLDGHQSDNCPNVSAEPSSHCDRCGQDGHVPRFCPKRMNVRERLGAAAGASNAAGYQGSGGTGGVGGSGESGSSTGQAFGHGAAMFKPRDVTCEKCNEVGHDKKDCKNRICKYCKETGHSKRDCPIGKVRDSRSIQQQQRQEDEAHYGKNSYNRNNSCRYCRGFDHEPWSCVQKPDYLCLKCNGKGHGFWECRNRAYCSFCEGPHQRRDCDVFPTYVKEASKQIPNLVPVLPPEWEDRKVRPNDIAPFRATYADWGRFSNFHPHRRITYWGHGYETVEHAYQARKAQFYRQPKLAAKVRRVATKDPMYTKTLVKDLTETKSWVMERILVMYDLVWLKAMYFHEFRKELVDSGEKILAEATSNTYWATGKNVDDTMAMHPSQWPGENILGRLLMTVRKELREGKSIHYIFLSRPIGGDGCGDDSDSDSSSDEEDDHHHHQQQRGDRHWHQQSSSHHQSSSSSSQDRRSSRWGGSGGGGHSYALESASGLREPRLDVTQSNGTEPRREDTFLTGYHSQSEYDFMMDITVDEQLVESSAFSDDMDNNVTADVMDTDLDDAHCDVIEEEDAEPSTEGSCEPVIPSSPGRLPCSPRDKRKKPAKPGSKRRSLSKDQLERPGNKKQLSSKQFIVSAMSRFRSDIEC